MLLLTETCARRLPRRADDVSTQANGVRYAVAQTGPVFEVRRREYVHGLLRHDQLVAAFPAEAEADDLARELTEKEYEHRRKR